MTRLKETIHLFSLRKGYPIVLWKESHLRKTILFVCFNTCAENSSATWLVFFDGDLWNRLTQETFGFVELSAYKIICVAESEMQSSLVTEALSFSWLHCCVFWHLLPFLQPWLMAADTVRTSAFLKAHRDVCSATVIMQRSLEMLCRCVLKPHTPTEESW